MDKETAVKQIELEFLTKNTVETLKLISWTIVKQCNSEKRKLTIIEGIILRDVHRLVQSWREYHVPNFDSELSDLIRMTSNDEGTSINRENYTTWLSPYGILNAATGSSTLNDAVLQRPTNTGDSTTIVYRRGDATT